MTKPIMDDEDAMRADCARELAASESMRQCRDALGADGSFSEMVEDVMRNFAGARFTAPVVEELLDHLRDRGWLSSGQSKIGFSRLQQSVGIEQFARLMVQKKYPQGRLNVVILWCMNSRTLDDVINHEYPAKWARDWCMSKWGVGKMVEFVQRELGLEKRPEQKNTAARDKMKAKANARYAANAEKN